MIQTVSALKRLELLRNSNEMREKLWQNVNKLQIGLKNLGYNLGETNTPITPVIIDGDMSKALAIVKILREIYGVFVSFVAYPVIPKGIIIFRMIPTSNHTDNDIDRTLEAFDKLRLN